jgi:prepilin-type N-terminal cleavage/methylation domain-containing protein
MRSSSRAFSLPEVLIVVVILGILSGCLMLVFGGSQENAKASKIFADLDAVKMAALAYAKDHGRRNFDPLSDDQLEGVSHSAAFSSAINGYLDTPIPADRNVTLTWSGGKPQVEFHEFAADESLARALDKLVSKSAGDGYSGTRGTGKYSLALLLK